MRGIASSGSVKVTAVASTVLGIKNPDVARSDEYTLNTTAPAIPAVRRVTSAATTGDCRNSQIESMTYVIYFVSEMKDP